MRFVLYRIARIRLYFAKKKAVRSKRRMDGVISKTCAAKEEIDRSYRNFLESTKKQQERAVDLRRIRKMYTDRPILHVNVNADRYTLSEQAEKVLTKLDVETALVRHRHGDWGAVMPDCWKHNNEAAVRKDGKVTSLYPGFGDHYFCVETDLTNGMTSVRMDGEAA